MIFIFNITALADGTDDMLKGNQDITVLGSVKDITSDKITVTVDYVLGRNGSELVGTDIQIKKFSYTYCEEHSTSDFRNPIISDNIVITLNSGESLYTIANSAYKVDSNEYANCKIVVLDKMDDDTCVKNLQRVTCYIRSNAMVNDFAFDSEGRIYAVYPQTAEQCLSTVDEDGAVINPEEHPENMPIVNNAPVQNEAKDENPNRSIYALAIILIGAVAGLVFAVIARLRKPKNDF